MLKLLGALVAANTVRDCSSGTSVFKFLTATVTPDPVVKGQDFTISLSCQIPDGVTVTSGTAQYGFTFNGIPFSPTTEELCSQVTCPLVPGLYSNATTAPFPDVSGKIVSTIKWFDDAKTLLYCLETTVKV
jgi:hypothetical protein